MDGWEVLKWGAILASGGVGSYALARGVLHTAGRLYDAVYERWLKARHDRLTLEHLADQNELRRVREIRADEHGRFPLLMGLGGILRDPNSLRSFTLRAVLERWPELERLDAIARIVLAGSGWPASTVADRMIPQESITAAQQQQWRNLITLDEMLRGQHPTLDDLVVGAYPTVDGLQIVSASLHDLMHVLEVGASGWGKSVWMRSFLYQVARAREAVEVVAIDPSGSAFNALHGWGKLRYPVARETRDAVAVLQQVGSEIAGRRQMYQQHPLVEDLPEYNRATGADLPPWVVVVDEGTHLLHQEGVGNVLREAVQTARQYGIYILLAGQSANASVISTEIRDQFSTRMCFHTSPVSTRVVLGESVDRPMVKGQAWVQMVGEELQQIQGPWVTKEQFLHSLSNGGPRHQMPVRAEVQPKVLLEDDPRNIEIVLGLRAEGKSDTAIARAVFGHGSTFYIGVVRRILERHNRDENEEDVEGEFTAVDE